MINLKSKGTNSCGSALQKSGTVLGLEAIRKGRGRGSVAGTYHGKVLLESSNGRIYGDLGRVKGLLGTKRREDSGLSNAFTEITESREHARRECTPG